MRPLTKILLIDDNPDDRLLVIHELKRELPEAVIQEVRNAAELVAALDGEFDLAVTDYRLCWGDGLEVLREIKGRYPGRPVVMFTGTGNEEVAVEAMKAGAEDYVLKMPNRLLRLAGVVRRAVERTQSAARAEQSERRLQNLLNRLHVGVFRATSDGQIIEANPSFLKLLGWEELPEGAHLRELYLRPEIHSEHMHHLKMAGELHEYTVELCRADGAPILASISQTLASDLEGEPVIDGLVEDISERVRLEGQVRQAQRLESISRLATGVAHDFNNILTIIQGYAGLLAQKDFDADSTFSLKSISAASDRAAALTRQLLAFSRSQVMRPEVLELNQFLRDVQNIIQHVLGDQTRVELSCAETLPLIRADEGLLTHVLTNLAVNSREAMPNGGRFSIATCAVELTSDDVRANIEARPGTFVCLTVVDSGCGIAPEDMSHVFEPFFTTKDVGPGTGLGLAAVYGVVKQHRGWVDVQSKVGHGTTFKMYFPAESRAVAAYLPSMEHLPFSATQTVLLVEDEPELLELVGEVLQSSGFRVLPAPNGGKALDVWRQSRQSIDLLVTDMKMPGGLGGLELAQKLVAENPRLKVLYTSGYSPEHLEPKVSLREGLNYLQKPYAPDRLISAIRRCLQSCPTKNPF